MLSTAHDCQSFDGLLKTESILHTKTNSCPLEHLCLLGEIGNDKGLVLCEKGFVACADQVIHFIEKVPAALDPLLAF